MRTGLDSAYPPSPAQIAQAKAAGYSSWSGYFAGPHILNGWSEADFHNVLNGGMETSAYCSGWSDPVAMKSQAHSWGVPCIILDDESGIRSMITSASEFPKLLSPNRRLARAMYEKGEARAVYELDTESGTWMVSAWVQPWLNASGAGLYGNAPVFPGASASCYVFAAYPGYDPKASWPTYYPRPAGGHACAWQYQGTTQMFGKSVDLAHYDDNFWASVPAPTGGVDMPAYVGPFHKWASPISLRAYVAGSEYQDPIPVFPLAAVAAAATPQVDGYCYCSIPTQATTPAGPDYVIWHVVGNPGVWIPDAILDTSKLAGAPGMAIPAAERAQMKLFPGQQGAPGLPGDKGQPGDKGPAGDKGATGDKGPAGDKGPQGDPGQAGGALPDHRHDITILQLFGGATGGVKEPS